MSKSITIQDLFNEIPSENISFQMVSNSLMEIDKGSSKKSAYIKLGVPEEVAMNFMHYTRDSSDVGMLVMIKREDFEKAKTALGL